MLPLTEWFTEGIRDLSREEVDTVSSGERRWDEERESSRVCLHQAACLIAQIAQRADIQYVARRNEIRQEYYDYFNSLSLDAMLCPVGPAPAQPVGTTKYWPYTSMWNLLDWPAAVFPTGLYVEEGDDHQSLTVEEARNADEEHLYRTCECPI